MYNRPNRKPLTIEEAREIADRMLRKSAAVANRSRIRQIKWEAKYGNKKGV